MDLTFPKVPQHTRAGLEDFKVHHVQRLLDAGLRVVLMVDDLPTLPAVMAAVGVPTLSVRPPYGA
jgi:hypothetical protein